MCACSSYKSPLTKLSRSEVKDELQRAQRQLFEQAVLPNVLEEEDPVVILDSDSLGFTQHIQQVLQDSREMQRNLETHIRKRMKKYGNEKRFLVNTPVEEVVKGFPEVELKWTFGDKEVVVPKAARLHLFHGWKKWRENEKETLKRELMENPELGKKYVAERQVDPLAIPCVMHSSFFLLLLMNLIVNCFSFSHFFKKILNFKSLNHCCFYLLMWYMLPFSGIFSVEFIIIFFF